MNSKKAARETHQEGTETAAANNSPEKEQPVSQVEKLDLAALLEDPDFGKHLVPPDPPTSLDEAVEFRTRDFLFVTEEALGKTIPRETIRYGKQEMDVAFVVVGDDDPVYVNCDRPQEVAVAMAWGSGRTVYAVEVRDDMLVRRRGRDHFVKLRTQAE
jgi:hypothetical protein